MIRLALMVGLGGFLGSALRFLIAQLFLKIITQITPLGTLLVNVLGSFLFGFLFQISGRMDRETLFAAFGRVLRRASPHSRPLL